MVRMLIVVTGLALLGGCMHRPSAGAETSQVSRAHRLGYRVVENHGTRYFCRKESVTGSYLTQNEVCLTEAQWKREAEGAQTAMDNMNRVPRAKGKDYN